VPNVGRSDGGSDAEDDMYLESRSLESELWKGEKGVVVYSLVIPVVGGDVRIN
jgi:hypothetical protein